MGNSTFVTVLNRIHRHPGILTQQLSSHFDQIDQSLDFLPEQKGQALVNILSDVLVSNTGSPHGCVVSPLLFILCTDSTLGTSESPSKAHGDQGSVNWGDENFSGLNWQSCQRWLWNNWIQQRDRRSLWERQVLLKAYNNPPKCYFCVDFQSSLFLFVWAALPSSWTAV